MTTVTNTTTSSGADAASPVVTFAPRMALDAAGPAMYRAMVALNAAVQQSGLEHSLLELVKVRASQINGCAYCLDRHILDAKAAGETDQRLNALAAWQESPFYTARERAALALAEAMTLVAETHVPDDVYDAAAAEFSEADLAALIWGVVVINAWNRAMVTVRQQPGAYRPGRR